VIIDVQTYLESIGIHRVENELKHYGTPRHSGRYPWGSGGEDTTGQRNKDFLGYVNDLKKQGMSEVDIARGMGMSVTQLRTSKSIAKNAQKAANVAMARRLADKQMSNVAIGERMGIPESSVRALLADGVKDKLDILQTTAGMLKEKVDAHGGRYIDIGTGVEQHIGVSRQKLDTAVALLKEQGYVVHKVQVDQIGTSNKTTIKVLAPPGTEYRDIVTNMENVHQIQSFSEDGGRSFLGVKEPLSISSKRVAIRYKEDGGADADGVIYVRRGVPDLSIGKDTYAQVRIAVDNSHYIKGMAIYKDDLPAGVDLVVNSNKTSTGNKLDALKPMKKNPDGSVDMDNPFGAVIRQRMDEHGKVTSVMNIVGSPNKEGSGEEGSWDTWSRNLPSQFLSKQSPTLAKTQLDMTYENKQHELDEIMRLTNPAVKRKLLESYADGADSSAVHLKAAALPRQSTHVILPIDPKKIKETEIYAPNFENGERVALVRFPHGGTFEIPELTVNNRNAEAKKILGKAADAVGIHPKVAERLSGADFDGDTVLVIPNNQGKIKSTPALEKLKNFDAKSSYPKYDGMKVMDARTKGFEMGDVSNLITDMTIKGAHPDEIARAVRHSMVVIDAEKHELNWKQSAIDNNIPQLKEKYQGKKNGGASTLISRANSQMPVRKRTPRPAKDGGPIDKVTGEKVFVETGEHWVDKKGKTVFRTQQSTKLAETKNAHTLVSTSNTKIENIYADHSNRMKALANQARLGLINTKSLPYSPSAKKAFNPEVQSLNAKLNIAIRNRPLERQAQVIANTMVHAKRQANPGMDSDDLKKVKFQALEEARKRTGAGKQRIVITDNEWAAIQAGAITNAKLTDILNNADLDRVKKLATPKADLLMTSTKTHRAEQMAKLGYTQAEIASALGVSVTTLKRSLGG
jgi:hypothetical protein